MYDVCSNGPPQLSRGNEGSAVPVPAGAELGNPLDIIQVFASYIIQVFALNWFFNRVPTKLHRELLGSYIYIYIYICNFKTPPKTSKTVLFN